jgi:DNA-binding CsgD family transcriptional regulator
MMDTLPDFSEIDQAIAAAPAAATLQDVEMVLRSAAGGAVTAVGFRWWRVAPERRADWRMETLEAAAHLESLPDREGDTWATLAVRVQRRERGESVVAHVPVVGRLRTCGALTAVISADQSTWSVAQNCWLGRLTMLANAVQERVENCSIDRSAARLAPREIECLSLAAEGLKAKQIADELGIGQQTVQFHLARARIKLGAGNTVEAVVRATQLALLRMRARPASPDA